MISTLALCVAVSICDLEDRNNSHVFPVYSFHSVINASKLANNTVILENRFAGNTHVNRVRNVPLHLEWLREMNIDILFVPARNITNLLWLRKEVNRDI